MPAPQFVAQKLHFLTSVEICMCSLKDTHNSFYCSSILIGQIWEITQRSIQERIEKYIAAFSYHRVWVSNKSEPNHCFRASANRMVTRVQRIYPVWFHLHILLKKAKLIYGDKNQKSFSFLGWSKVQSDWEVALEKLLELWQNSLPFSSCGPLSEFTAYKVAKLCL